jgi:hypothetical protein
MPRFVLEPCLRAVTLLDARLVFFAAMAASHLIAVAMCSTTDTTKPRQHTGLLASGQAF